MKRYLIVVAGWHYYNNGFYGRIKKLCENNPNINVFISSHKTENEIDKNIINLINSIPMLRIYHFENIGFDWGMYSQAVDYLSSSIQDYDYICFVHDDIEIKELNFLNVFSVFIEENNLVLAGNCRNRKLHDWRKTHPHVIEWARLSEWKIDIQSEKWSTVRGSFFMVKTDVLRKIKRIPYKNGAHEGFGNWAVITFSGLVSDMYGVDSIKTISDQDLTSPYIDEYKRGVNEIRPGDTNTVAIDYSSVIERPLKVHIGCGKNYFEGYLNIDQFDNSVADVVDDITNISFRENSISEFLMYHFLEHLNEFDAEKLLNNLYIYLCPGGALIIEAPDILKVAKLIIKNKKNYEELEYGAYGLRGFYGEPFEKMDIGDYHKWGYSEYTLTKKLKNIGFSKIWKEKPVSHGGRKNRDLRIIAIK